MSIRDERKQQSRQALLDAALRLSTSGRSFSSISLREVAREVGLVPTAFYRHFQDMDHLGQELLDQVALHLKQCYISWVWLICHSSAVNHRIPYNSFSGS